MNPLKILSVILSIAVIGLAIVFYQSNQAAKQQIADTQSRLDSTRSTLDTTRTELSSTHTQLVATSNQLVSAEQAVTDAKTAAQAKAEEARLLQQNVEQLETEKRAVEQQLQQATDRTAELSRNLDTARAEIEQKNASVESLEKTRNALDAQLAALNHQLAAVQKSLADLDAQHTTTVGHLKAMREDYVKLTTEKELLEAKMNDLDELSAQVRVVKNNLHQAKVNEQQRLDRAETVMGNAGFLMKQGEWQVARQPGKYPLATDIKRDE
jgi:myosin protein heavy chain